MKVRLTFTEPVLGTLSGNKEIASEFTFSKHPDGVTADEEEAHPDEVLEKSSTIFARTDGVPHLWNYQIEGFFKEACAAMLHNGTFSEDEEEQAKAKKNFKRYRLTEYLYKKTIDESIFVTTRQIYFQGITKGQVLAFCERPLRGQTMKGERVALARSEMVPAGTTIEFGIKLLNPALAKFVRVWLDYGAFKGIGQWRNSGMGRFTWEELP